jgi:hypothetical protein
VAAEASSFAGLLVWHSGRVSDVYVPVEVPQLGDERLKNWAKVVRSVDEGKATGWAFEGDFIATGGIQDVPAGSVILVYGERGSRANPRVEAKLFTANGDGTLSQEAEARGRAWARTLRDKVAELLDAESPGGEALDWQPELMRYTEAALREELGRRGRRS